jgi:hypothetical protein
MAWLGAGLKTTDADAMMRDMRCDDAKKRAARHTQN